VGGRPGELRPLEEAVVAITGASSGIGRAAALRRALLAAGGGAIAGLLKKS
jgi:NAD(P)-dependent dehydrogenase (short-subunit alcohol dehydrogenase family)